MSPNQICVYCKVYEEGPCRSQEQATVCPTYQRRELRKKVAQTLIEPTQVTVAEIDAAIETLKKVKQGLT